MAPTRWIVDLRHFLEEDGSLVEGPAARLARQWTYLVKAASVRPPDGGWAQSATRCHRRPGRGRCAGHVVVNRRGDDGPIHWECPACGAGGCIDGWPGTAWDLRGTRAPAEGCPLVEVTLSDDEYEALREWDTMSGGDGWMVAAATVRDGRVVVALPGATIAGILCAIAAEANRSPNRRRQRGLEDVYVRFREAAARDPEPADESKPPRLC